MSGSPDAAEALSRRLVGNQGPTVDSVLQQTTDRFEDAQTVADYGFLAQNLILGAAGMVGPGSATITTNRGFSVPRFGGAEPPTLDLFGGKTSQIPGAINVDLQATSGVRASTTALPFRSNYFTDVVASGPRAEFLPEASRVMSPGGQLFINSTQRNTFGQLPNASTLQNLRFRVIQENGPLSPRFQNFDFRFTDGNPIRGTQRTTILERY